MPGRVSDRFHPEFGTAARAWMVIEALQAVDQRLSRHLGPQLLDILDVVESRHARRRLKGSRVAFGPRDLRLIRFAIRRTMESI